MKLVDLLSDDLNIERQNRDSNVLYEVKTEIKKGAVVTVYSWKLKSQLPHEDDRYDE